MTLTSALPQITSAITLVGNSFTIARDGGAPQFLILNVTSSGNLTLNETTITGGNVSGNGGGIYNEGTLTLTNSTVSGNNASNSAGGIYNAGTLTMTNSTVSGNTTNNLGGGITTYGTLTMTNSTVSGNQATNAGGGIQNGGTATLINSTVSGNFTNFGGGINNNGTLTLTRSLISGNTGSNGAEIHNFSGFMGSPPALLNSANFNVFGHSAQTNAQAFANFTPSGSDITATSDGTDPTALAAILGPLANNGGPTFTHALVSGSPAVDAAPSGPATDQRGVTRPQGTGFDSGAFELEQISNTAPVATNDSYRTNEDTALSVPAPGVLGNDTDADSDALTAVLVSGPAHGTLTLNPNGSFTYTPAANYSGADSFSYTASDGTASSNVATVSLTVVSALDQIDALIADVEALVASGTLNGGQGNALITKLEGAASYVDSGQNAKAIGRMQAFISQVNSFISSGVLTAAEGQPLIDAANAVIQSLGG